MNDVVLAACSAGIRNLLLQRGEEPPHGLRAMVPVNLRHASERLALGNKITSLFVPLPVDEPDPPSPLCAGTPQRRWAEIWVAGPWWIDS